MKIIPALYIQNGSLVSFYKGTDNLEKKRYAKAPKTLARLFHKQGAKTLFVIDLDGDQQERLSEIREEFPGELWWAGQVRSLDRMQQLFDLGADRIVLGQSASPIYIEALERFGAVKIIAGLQLQHYDEAPELCENLAEKGFDSIMVKDLNAEGTLVQPNFDLMEKCHYFSGKDIYASGGIAENLHLQLMQQAGVAGVIIARAFYENHLSLSQAVHHYESDGSSSHSE